MSTKQVAFEIKQGDSWVASFKLATRVPNRTSGGFISTPINLTGATARLMARTSVSAGTTAVSATIDNSQISINAAEGTISLDVPPSVTDDLLGSYVWDLEVTYSNDQVQTVAEGTLVVTQGVTRDA